MLNCIVLFGRVLFYCLGNASRHEPKSEETAVQNTTMLPAAVHLFRTTGNSNRIETTKVCLSTCIP